jgi:thioredoxin reductase (NADPH)
MDDVKKVVIIGSGPAGYTAAIYAGRANLEPVLFSGLQPGGQLTITTEVENYPPFPKGVQGPELMMMFREHADRFAKEILETDVTAVDFTQRPFRIDYDGGSMLAKSVIVATGASARWLGLASENRLRGKGVSACATCDGFFFRGKPVAVVGGGDTAVEEATYLTRFASHVYLVHRRDELRASKIMQARARSNPKLTLVWNSVVDEILGDDATGVTGARLKDARTGELSTLDVKGVFVAIGHEPNTQLFKGQLALDANGYIKTEPGTTRTSVPGVFAAGDVQDAYYRQAVTAAGSGCMAAIDVERWLEH